MILQRRILKRPIILTLCPSRWTDEIQKETELLDMPHAGVGSSFYHANPDYSTSACFN